MNKQFLSLAGTCALALSLTACGSTDQPVETPTTVNPADSLAVLAGDSARIAKPKGVLVDGVAMTGDKDIVDNAQGAKSVSTLVAALKQARLVDALKASGPFTVFAPTNDAFGKLPNGAVDALMKPESKEKLKGVLTYHVIPGRLLAADFKDGQEFTTLNGQKLHIALKDGKVLVSNGTDAAATVQIADVISKNGVTHVIDGVVLPTE